MEIVQLLQSIISMYCFEIFQVVLSLTIVLCLLNLSKSEILTSA